MKITKTRNKKNIIATDKKIEADKADKADKINSEKKYKKHEYQENESNNLKFLEPFDQNGLSEKVINQNTDMGFLNNEQKYSNIETEEQIDNKVQMLNAVNKKLIKQKFNDHINLKPVILKPTILHNILPNSNHNIENNLKESTFLLKSINNEVEDGKMNNKK